MFVLLPIHVKHIINIYKIKAVLLKSLKLMKLNFFMFIREKTQDYKQKEKHNIKELIHIYTSPNNNDVEDNDFKPIVDRVIELNGCFVTGPPGTGKSQLIRQIKQELQNKGKTFSCLAPTNLAAINIKGTTVLKFVSKLKKWNHYII